VRRLAFIQCVGSRDRRFLPYCSGYCCTASIKEAMLALEHEPDAELPYSTTTIRTSGKGFEELYLRAQAAGVRFIKGLPGRITEDDEGRPVIVFEDQERGGREEADRGYGGPGRGLEASGEPLPFVDLARPKDGLAFTRSAIPSCIPWNPA